MEKEYIERDAALCMIQANEKRITPIEENRDMFYHDSGWNGASVAMKVEMRKIPAADVVEVVRCKDCKHGQRGRYGYMCEYDRVKQYMNGEHYCSFGEEIVE